MTKGTLPLPRTRPCAAGFGKYLLPSLRSSFSRKASLTGLAYAWLPVARRKGRVAFRNPNSIPERNKSLCI